MDEHFEYLIIVSWLKSDRSHSKNHVTMKCKQTFPMIINQLK